MKKFLKFNFKLILVFAMVFASIFGAKTFSKNLSSPEALATGAGEPEDINMSIFIRKPTYSCLIDDKIFFIDDHDKILKVYNTFNSYFEEQYLDISDYEIIDVEVLNDSFYMIVSSTDDNNKIVQIKLAEFDGEVYNTSLEVVEFDYEFDSVYDSIFIQNLTFGEDDYLLVSLTPSENTASPLMVLFDETNQATDIPISFGTEQEAVSIKENLIKMFTLQDETEKLYILFVYNIDGGARISHVSVDNYSALLEYKTSKINTGITVLTSDLLKNRPNSTVFDVNFMTFDSESHIVVTYKEDNSYLLGFTPNILLDADEFDLVGTHTCYNPQYMLIRNDVLTYCNGQELYYSIISHETDGSSGSLIYADDVIISNPACEITYFEEKNFVYKTTKAPTKLLEHPWDFDEIIEIGSNQDVIHIGTIQIKRIVRAVGAIQIEDYDYCLYTFNGKNHLGYVKNSDLTTKTEVSLKDSGYNYVEDSEGKVSVIVKVWPKTSLYTLPTNILGSITQGLVSDSDYLIEDNSKVEIIDTLYNYTCDGKKFVKVRVNDTKVGYIDASHIYSPKEVVDFVITNATIGHDNTKVYIAADITSAVIYELNEGKHVRIDGKRDTQTGFTKITFNDEYGREITGYIVSDYVEADSWSTLQIVGSILIAINIGLLILILVYKNKHLSKDNAKKTEKF